MCDMEFSNYIVKVKRPDGTIYQDEYNTFKEAFDAYWSINLCPGYKAEIYSCINKSVV